MYGYQMVYRYATGFDLLGRPTNAYTANALNQYARVDAAAFVYDADGNLTHDGVCDYAYDAENRLISVTPRQPSEDAFAVSNSYDHRHRRTRKVVTQFANGAWQPYATHTFVWDDGNIILERVVFADGTTCTCECFWGPDLSGAEQGAGGVGGLLAVALDGAFHFPCYDHNGNIVAYVSESGGLSAQYVYDPYGNLLAATGPLASQFAFGFSTKIHDREVGLISYQRRFYSPSLGRWLNRDPIEEDGGENLYAMCMNKPSFTYDSYGLATSVIKHPPGSIPLSGWKWTNSLAETHWTYPSYETTLIPCGKRKVGYKVKISPPVTIIHVYFRDLVEYFLSMSAEQQHIDAIVQYDQALTQYKNALESICKCPSEALEDFKREEKKLRQVFQETEDYHDWLDSPGGPHGHH